MWREKIFLFVALNFSLTSRDFLLGRFVWLPAALRLFLGLFLPFPCLYLRYNFSRSRITTRNKVPVFFTKNYETSFVGFVSQMYSPIAVIVNTSRIFHTWRISGISKTTMEVQLYLCLYKLSHNWCKLETAFLVLTGKLC